jgi:protein phosphatase
MILSAPLIHCSNPACNRPLNTISEQWCENCRTPLEYNYLWAVGKQAAKLTLGEMVQGRYLIIKPQIWLDTRPDLQPDILASPNEEMLPYLLLYGHNWHLPEIYGYCQVLENSSSEIILLKNAPIDTKGNLYASITEAWENAKSVRKIYWLWQILELWKVLKELGAASTLLDIENIRTESWRIRICQLHPDPELNRSKITLNQLGKCWQKWFTGDENDLSERINNLCEQMQNGGEFEAIAENLNQLLLEEAAKLHLRLRIVGATDSGDNSEHNEDHCYPLGSDLLPEYDPDPLRKYLSIVCDGIDGHEGGEVASQLAVQSIKLQVMALIKEVEEQEEIMMPDLVKEQISAIIRVANNLIASRNDQQGRSARKRMATTLVMAIQLPQKIVNPNIIGNSHELYIAHVGNSRAYFLTNTGCLKLTLDDNMATKEVKMGNSIYSQAIKEENATALTQALGTKDADFLRPTVQRLIIEEDGLLLLCSDGLSDNDWVEKTWQDYTKSVLTAQMSLENAVESLINLAKEKNGHDNISVVLTYCKVSPEYPILVNIPKVEGELEQELVNNTHNQSFISAIIPVSRSTEEDILDAEATPVKKQRKLGKLVLLISLLLLVTGLAGGSYYLWLTQPQKVEEIKQKIINKFNR